MRHTIHFPVALAIVAIGAIAFPVQAAAHVEPDPSTLPVAAAVTVSFLVEHGCDDAATVAVALRFPEEIADPQPVDKVGWTASVAGNVVTFRGGPLPATAEDGFTVAFTTPSIPGSWPVPIVQSCEVGEMAWVQIVEPGQPESEYPAPILVVGEPVVTAEPMIDPGVIGSDVTGPDVIGPAAGIATASNATNAALAGVVPTPHRSARDLLIGACFGSVLAASVAVAFGRRRRAPV